MLIRKIEITLLLCLIFASLSQAQLANRRGYIAIGVGPSFLLGYKTSEGSKAGIGANINLVNFNYEFGKGFGVSAAWVGGTHRFKTEWMTTDINGAPLLVKSDWEVGYAVIMIGPMYSVKFPDNTSLQVKARCGWFKESEKVTSSYSFGTSSGWVGSVGYSLAVSYQKNIAPRWCMIVTSNYYSSGRRETLFSSKKDRFVAISINAGIGFLL